MEGWTEARLHALASAAAERILRKEQHQVTAAAAKFIDDRPGWEHWVRRFYADHAAMVSDTLRCGRMSAEWYTERQAVRVVDGGVAAFTAALPTAAAELSQLARSGGLDKLAEVRDTGE